MSPEPLPRLSLARGTHTHTHTYVYTHTHTHTHLLNLVTFQPELAKPTLRVIFHISAWARTFSNTYFC